MLRLNIKQNKLTINDTFRFGGYDISNSTIISVNDKIVFTGKANPIGYGVGVINLGSKDHSIVFYKFKCVKYSLLNIKGVNEGDMVAFWNDYTGTDCDKNTSQNIDVK